MVARCGDIPNFVAAAAIHDLTNAVRNGLEPAHGVHAVARLVMSKQAGVFTIWWKLECLSPDVVRTKPMTAESAIRARFVRDSFRVLGRQRPVPSVLVALWYR